MPKFSYVMDGKKHHTVFKANPANFVVIETFTEAKDAISYALRLNNVPTEQPEEIKRDGVPVPAGTMKPQPYVDPVVRVITIRSSKPNTREKATAVWSAVKAISGEYGTFTVREISKLSGYSVKETRRLLSKLSEVLVGERSRAYPHTVIFTVKSEYRKAKLVFRIAGTPPLLAAIEDATK